MITTRPIRRRRSVAASLALLATTPLVVLAGGPAAQAAGSKACDGGGFTVLGKSAATGFDGAVAAPASRFSVQGKYTRLDIEPADFAVYDYGFTGAANQADITGGRPTPAYASKIPDHRGLIPTSLVTLKVRGADLVISRTGTADLSMKIQAKDCAQGGIFQMEPARGDGTRTGSCTGSPVRRSTLTT